MVPVEDCIATTGSMPGKGCDTMGVEGRGDCVWSAVKEREGSKVTVDGKYFSKEIGGVDEAGKEYKAEEMLASLNACQSTWTSSAEPKKSQDRWRIRCRRIGERVTVGVAKVG